MPPPALLLEPSRPAAQGARAPADRAERDGAEGGGALVCKACRHRVTSDRARISAFGGHAHDRMNPAGFVFRVGLFSVAPGAIAVGAPCAEFAWFPGHRWQVVLCRGCLEHLGWRFTGSSSFNALVLDRLEPAGDGPEPEG